MRRPNLVTSVRFGLQVVILTGTLTSAIAARGSVVTSLGANGDYPDNSWDGTKAFLRMYDFTRDVNVNPKIFVGHSAGGNISYSSAASVPSATICVTPCAWKHNEPSSALKDIPVFTLTGDGDFGDFDVDMALKANAAGGRESVAWHMGHEHNFNEPDLLYLYWIECIRLRYPPGSSLKTTPREQGWLGDMSKESWTSDCPYIAPYSEYKRDKSKAAWLPTRYFAFAWRAYVPMSGRTARSPILITTPKKGGQWTGWPIVNAGASVPIQASYRGTQETRLAFFYGDNLIKSLPRNTYGIYSATWTAVAGIHAILAVAYNKDNQPVATARMVPIIVNGTVKYSPVDNASIENTVLFVATSTNAPRALTPCIANGPENHRYCLVNGRSTSVLGNASGKSRVPGIFLAEPAGGSAVGFRVVSTDGN